MLLVGLDNVIDVLQILIFKGVPAKLLRRQAASAGEFIQLFIFKSV